MTNFGDPSAVAAAATELLATSRAVEAAVDTVKTIKSDRWQGETADAFRVSIADSIPPAYSIADSLRSAFGTLTRYSEAQRQAQTDFNNAQVRVDGAAERINADPFSLSARIDYVSATSQAYAAMGRLQQAASIAAQELLEASTYEEVPKHPWWDPFGWFTDEADPLEHRPNKQVDDDLLESEGFDSTIVRQGSIGDCFLISSVISMLDTDEGDEFIGEHVRWDPDSDGYWVTLYPDGQPKEVFVDKVYAHGSTRALSGRPPSMASLYEAAFAQEFGYGYLDGGYSSHALEVITGKESTTLSSTFRGGLTSGHREELRGVLEDGGQVIASSSKTRNPTELSITRHDGTVEEVRMVGQHAYVVTKIESDGSMWVHNPWGPNNSYDGGGEFKVSADDVPRVFWRANYININD